MTRVPSTCSLLPPPLLDAGRVDGKGDDRVTLESIVAGVLEKSEAASTKLWNTAELCTEEGCRCAECKTLGGGAVARTLENIALSAQHKAWQKEDEDVAAEKRRQARAKEQQRVEREKRKREREEENEFAASRRQHGAVPAPNAQRSASSSR